MDDRCSLLDNDVRLLASSKLGSSKLLKTQLSALCAGPKCGVQEGVWRGYDLLWGSQGLVLWKVTARGCCCRKWARCESSEGLRQRQSSLALGVVVGTRCGIPGHQKSATGSKGQSWRDAPKWNKLLLSCLRELAEIIVLMVSTRRVLGRTRQVRPSSAKVGKYPVLLSTSTWAPGVHT